MLVCICFTLPLVLFVHYHTASLTAATICYLLLLVMTSHIEPGKWESRNQLMRQLFNGHDISNGEVLLIQSVHSFEMAWNRLEGMVLRKLLRTMGWT